MRLHVQHDTVYDYTPAVETAQHMAHLRPSDSPWQSVHEHTLVIDPQPTHQQSVQDVFGNTRTFFALQQPHERLEVSARSVVSTQAPTAPTGPAVDLAWDSVRERMRYHAQLAYDPAVEFVFASDYAPRHADFLTYARASFPAGAPLIECACSLMSRIHRDFDYVAESTEISTPALQALSQRHGVCQDFAHVMVACLRSLGLPARYVSGYLLTEPPPGQPRLVGSDASHAWGSVYLPGLDAQGELPCWIDLDPTNDRWGWGTPGEDYVHVASGRDYGDVSPMRGVIHGGAHHLLHVGVTVTPLEREFLNSDPDSPKARSS